MVLKFFALLLVFGGEGGGTLLGVQHKPESFTSLKLCNEEIVEQASRLSMQPLPQGVAKIKFVCLPVSDQT
jgi:hypothetical protein